MNSKLAVTLLLAWIVLFNSAKAAPAAPYLSVLEIYDDDNCLCIDFYLKNAIEGELLESVRSGIPALLTYTVEVWRDRSRWYDKLINGITYSYKITYDQWDTLYQVDAASPIREERKRADDVAELVHTVCNQKGVKACSLDELDSSASYYVTIAGEVESLSAERLREIDSWLGGHEEPEDKGGGLLGFVVGLFTSKSKRAQTKSELFSLEGLIR